MRIVGAVRNWRIGGEEGIIGETRDLWEKIGIVGKTRNCGRN